MVTKSGSVSGLKVGGSMSGGQCLAKINSTGSLRPTPFLALVPRCSIYILDYEQRWVKSITNL